MSDPWPPAPVPAARRGRSGRTRQSLALVLVVIGCLLTPFAVIGSFVRNDLADTDRFASTVAPLADDAAVQAALVQRVTGEIIRLAEQLQPGAVTPEQVDAIARSFVASPQFQELWDQVVRQAHPQLQQVLLGRDTALVRSRDGRVEIDLGELARQVQARLVAAGVAVAATFDLGAVDWRYTLVESDRLAAVQSATNQLQRFVPWLVLAMLGTFAAALLLAPRRHRVLVWMGVGLLVSAAGVAAGLLAGRSQYLAAVRGVIDEDAAAAVYRALVEPLVERVRVWIVIAFGLLAVGGVLTLLRRRRGDDPRTAGDWLAGHGVDVVVVAVAAVAAAVVWSQQPTLAVLALCAGSVAAITVLVIAVGRPPAADAR